MSAQPPLGAHTIMISSFTPSSVVRLAAALVLAFAPGAYGKLLPGAEAQAACFQLADWTLQSGEALRAGVPKEQHQSAGERDASSRREERRAAIEAVYRDRPGDLSDYIAAKLGGCLRVRGADVGDLMAKACYDQTLWAGTFFESRRRGIALERLLEGYGRDAVFSGARLAEAVYGTDKSELEFRRDLFVDCVIQLLPGPLIR